MNESWVSLCEENERLKDANERSLLALEEMRTELARSEKHVVRMDDIERSMLLDREHYAIRMYQAAMSRLEDRSMLENVHYMDMLVKLPPRSISEVLTAFKQEPVIMTTYQPPYFVEVRACVVKVYVDFLSCSPLHLPLTSYPAHPSYPLLQYANKAWSDLCEWAPHEVLGQKLTFMQGAQTDKKVTRTFMSQVGSFGYGCMTVINYTKSRRPFVVTLKVFPVYDAVSATGCDSDQPMLTHLATILTCIVDVAQEFGDSALAQKHVFRENQPLFSDNGLGTGAGRYYSARQGDVGGGGSSHVHKTLSAFNSSENAASQKRTRMEPSGGDGEGENGEETGKQQHEPVSGEVRGLTLPEHRHANVGGCDRRSEARCQSPEAAMEEEPSHPLNWGASRLRFVDLAKHDLSLEDFVKISYTARLSDLLRLMVICRNPIVITDVSGRILHANKGWSELTGFSLGDVEGLTCRVLQGPATDSNEVARCMAIVRGGARAEMEVVNYKKDQTPYLAKVAIVPLKGAYQNQGKSRLCDVMWVFIGEIRQIRHFVLTNTFLLTRILTNRDHTLLRHGHSRNSILMNLERECMWWAGAGNGEEGR